MASFQTENREIRKARRKERREKRKEGKKEGGKEKRKERKKEGKEGRKNTGKKLYLPPPPKLQCFDQNFSEVYASHHKGSSYGRPISKESIKAFNPLLMPHSYSKRNEHFPLQASHRVSQSGLLSNTGCAPK